MAVDAVMRANGMTVLELDFDEDVIAHRAAPSRAFAAAGEGGGAAALRRET